MNEVWIIDACRTPRGIGKNPRGSLSAFHPQQLGAAVLSALAQRNGIKTEDVEDVLWGTSAQTGTQRGDLGRMAALDAGYDIRSSGITLDRFCGSGLSAVNLAAAMVMSGQADLVVAGGTEMMSTFDRRQPDKVPPVFDAGNLRLRASHPQTHQGICADAVATLEGIDREVLDLLALESQQRAQRAISEGAFRKSIVPVFHENGQLALDRDEHPRPGTTLEDLAALTPSFASIADLPVDETGATFRSLLLQKFPGLEIDFVHHAGNSSGVVDGAAAVLLASPAYARAHDLRPRARVLATANMGSCPTLMVNAPAPATRKVLSRAGLELSDIDLFEVNEAFAVVVEKYIRELGIDRDRINVNGGAIALGHPIGATGAILVGTLIDELERRQLQRGLVTMCTGGGMAPALIIERIN